MVSEAIKILLMLQKSGFYSPVEGTVVFIPFFYKVFVTSKRWLCPRDFSHQSDGVTWHHGGGGVGLIGHNETTVICHQVWTLSVGWHVGCGQYQLKMPITSLVQLARDLT